MFGKSREPYSMFSSLPANQRSQLPPSTLQPTIFTSLLASVNCLLCSDKNKERISHLDSFISHPASILSKRKQASLGWCSQELLYETKDLIISNDSSRTSRNNHNNNVPKLLATNNVDFLTEFVPAYEKARPFVYRFTGTKWHDNVGRSKLHFLDSSTTRIRIRKNFAERAHPSLEDLAKLFPGEEIVTLEIELYFFQIHHHHQNTNDKQSEKNVASVKKLTPSLKAGTKNSAAKNDGVILLDDEAESSNSTSPVVSSADDADAAMQLPLAESNGKQMETFNGRNNNNTSFNPTQTQNTVLLSGNSDSYNEHAFEQKDEDSCHRSKSSSVVIMISGENDNKGNQKNVKKSPPTPTRDLQDRLFMEVFTIFSEKLPRHPRGYLCRVVPVSDILFRGLQLPTWNKMMMAMMNTINESIPKSMLLHDANNSSEDSATPQKNQFVFEHLDDENEVTNDLFFGVKNMSKLESLNEPFKTSQAEQPDKKIDHSLDEESRHFGLTSRITPLSEMGSIERFFERERKLAAHPKSMHQVIVDRQIPGEPADEKYGNRPPKIFESPRNGRSAADRGCWAFLCRLDPVTLKPLIEDDAFFETVLDQHHHHHHHHRNTNPIVEFPSKTKNFIHNQNAQDEMDDSKNKAKKDTSTVKTGAEIITILDDDDDDDDNLIEKEIVIVNSVNSSSSVLTSQKSVCTPRDNKNNINSSADNCVHQLQSSLIPLTGELVTIGRNQNTCTVHVPSAQENRKLGIPKTNSQVDPRGIHCTIELANYYATLFVTSKTHTCTVNGKTFDESWKSGVPLHSGDTIELGDSNQFQTKEERFGTDYLYEKLGDDDDDNDAKEQKIYTAEGARHRRLHGPVMFKIFVHGNRLAWASKSPRVGMSEAIMKSEKYIEDNLKRHVPPHAAKKLDREDDDDVTLACQEEVVFEVKRVQENNAWVEFGEQEVNDGDNDDEDLIIMTDPKQVQINNRLYNKIACRSQHFLLRDNSSLASPSDLWTQYVLLCNKGSKLSSASTRQILSWNSKISRSTLVALLYSLSYSQKYFDGGLAFSPALSLLQRFFLQIPEISKENRTCLQSAKRRAITSDMCLLHFFDEFDNPVDNPGKEILNRSFLPNSASDFRFFLTLIRSIFSAFAVSSAVNEGMRETRVLFPEFLSWLQDYATNKTVAHFSPLHTETGFFYSFEPNQASDWYFETDLFSASPDSFVRDNDGQTFMNSRRYEVATITTHMSREVFESRERPNQIPIYGTRKEKNEYQRNLVSNLEGSNKATVLPADDKEIDAEDSDDDDATHSKSSETVSPLTVIRISNVQQDDESFQYEDCKPGYIIKEFSDSSFFPNRKADVEGNLSIFQRDINFDAFERNGGYFFRALQSHSVLQSTWRMWRNKDVQMHDFSRDFLLPALDWQVESFCVADAALALVRICENADDSSDQNVENNNFVPDDDSELIQVESNDGANQNASHDHVEVTPSSNNHRKQCATTRLEEPQVETERSKSSQNNTAKDVNNISPMPTTKANVNNNNHHHHNSGADQLQNSTKIKKISNRQLFGAITSAIPFSDQLSIEYSQILRDGPKADAKLFGSCGGNLAFHIACSNIELYRRRFFYGLNAEPQDVWANSNASGSVDAAERSRRQDIFGAKHEPRPFDLASPLRRDRAIRFVAQLVEFSDALSCQPFEIQSAAIVSLVTILSYESFKKFHQLRSSRSRAAGSSTSSSEASLRDHEKIVMIETTGKKRKTFASLGDNFQGYGHSSSHLSHNQIVHRVCSASKIYSPERIQLVRECVSFLGRLYEIAIKLAQGYSLSTRPRHFRYFSEFKEENDPYGVQNETHSAETVAAKRTQFVAKPLTRMSNLYDTPVLQRRREEDEIWADAKLQSSDSLSVTIRGVACQMFNVIARPATCVISDEDLRDFVRQRGNDTVEGFYAKYALAAREKNRERDESDDLVFDIDPQSREILGFGVIKNSKQENEARFVTIEFKPRPELYPARKVYADVDPASDKRATRAYSQRTCKRVLVSLLKSRNDENNCPVFELQNLFCPSRCKITAENHSVTNGGYRLEKIDPVKTAHRPPGGVEQFIYVETFEFLIQWGLKYIRGGKRNTHGDNDDDADKSSEIPDWMSWTDEYETSPQQGFDHSTKNVHFEPVRIKL